MMTPCETICNVRDKVRWSGRLDWMIATVDSRTFGRSALCDAVAFADCYRAALVGPTFESALLPPRWHGIAQIMAGLSLGAVSLGFHRMAFAQLTAL